MKFETYSEIMDRERKLEKERERLIGTLYFDFEKKNKVKSIYKSITITQVEDGVAYYECEAYDDAYNTKPSQFRETLNKIHRAFKKYHRQIFKKYNVRKISVTIYDEWSAVAGIEVVDDEITDWNF